MVMRYFGDSLRHREHNLYIRWFYRRLRHLVGASNVHGACTQYERKCDGVSENLLSVKSLFARSPDARCQNGGLLRPRRRPSGHALRRAADTGLRIATGRTASGRPNYLFAEELVCCSRRSGQRFYTQWCLLHSTSATLVGLEPSRQTEDRTPGSAFTWAVYGFRVASLMRASLVVGTDRALVERARSQIIAKSIAATGTAFLTVSTVAREGASTSRRKSMITRCPGTLDALGCSAQHANLRVNVCVHYAGHVFRGNGLSIGIDRALAGPS